MSPGASAVLQPLFYRRDFAVATRTFGKDNDEAVIEKLINTQQLSPLNSKETGGLWY